MRLCQGETLAPRDLSATVQRWIMKSPKRWLPRGTEYNERAIALAKQLEIDIPPQPLTNAQFVSLWAEIGKVLLPFEPPEPVTLQQLWAEIGMFLAEEKEPEFAWGRGRRPGSKYKFPQPKS